MKTTEEHLDAIYGQFLVTNILLVLILFYN